MTLPPPEEPSQLSAERPVRSEFARPSGLSYATRRVLTICFLLLVVGGGFYFAFGHSHPTDTDEVPTIKAEGTVKERPAQPGGIDIPHQDVQVYRELEGNNASKPQVEHLLPPSETPAASATPPLPVQKPVPPPEATTPPVPKMESLLSSPPKVETTVTQVTSSSPPLPVLSTQSQTPVASMSPPQTPVPSPTPAVTPVPAAPLAATVPPAVKAGPVVASTPVVDTTKTPAASKASSGKKGTAVQLASTPDESNAHNMVNALQDKYAGILGPVKLRIVKANLGAKGIYYRIQSQPVTKEQADNICAAVKGIKAGCIIVHL